MRVVGIALRAAPRTSGAAARVSPTDTAWIQIARRARPRRVAAEALADAFAIARLAPPAPPQAQQDQRQRGTQQPGVERPQAISSRRGDRPRAALGGVPTPPRNAVRPVPSGWASSGSESQKMPSTGTRSAAARCISPVSTPTTSLGVADQAAGLCERHARRHHGARDRGGEPLGARALVPRRPTAARRPGRARRGGAPSSIQPASRQSFAARAVECSSTQYVRMRRRRRRAAARRCRSRAARARSRAPAPRPCGSARPCGRRRRTRRCMS